MRVAILAASPSPTHLLLLTHLLSEAEQHDYPFFFPQIPYKLPQKNLLTNCYKVDNGTDTLQ
jgi:hypothetical protein